MTIISLNKMNTRMKPRRNYSIEFKSRVILFYQSLQHKKDVREKSINKIANIVNIDRRVISAWIKKKDKLLNPNACNEESQSNDQSACPMMENLLFNWIIECMQLGIFLTGDTIRKQALKIYELFHPAESTEIPVQLCPLPRTNFSASKGWLENFCRRRNLELKLVSNSGLIDDKNNFEIINQVKEIPIQTPVDEESQMTEEEKRLIDLLVSSNNSASNSIQIDKTDSN